jgi:L-alanine-DL-glutamate epimerase-like enolase superfamily enzyme
VKIANYQTSAVRVPREHSPNAPGSDTIDFIPVTLRTDDGITGISYAGFASQMLTRGLKEVVDAVCEQVIGDNPMETEAIAQRLLRVGGGGAPAGLLMRAISAIDVALWDIKGKALGQPVAKLLGGYRDTVPTYASGFLWRSFDLEALAEHGQRLVKEGFTSMKFRMGGEVTPAREVARIHAIREAVGGDINLMVDINQGWDVNQAVTIGREMDHSHLYWLEDPIHYQDYLGLARISDALDTPLAAGEYHYGVAPFRHMLEHRSLGIVMVDLLRVGGLTQWMKVAHMAEVFNLPVVTHLAPEILVHALAAVPNGLTVEYMPWAFPLFKEVPQPVNGMLTVRDIPGLGLEFDEERLAADAIN